MADIIKIGKLSVCRKPITFFADCEYHKIEIDFTRELTDKEFEVLADLAFIINDKGVVDDDSGR